jgi:hypothetical protein
MHGALKKCLVIVVTRHFFKNAIARVYPPVAGGGVV